MTEVDVEESEAKADANETHFLVSKLETSKAPVVPSCISSCDGDNTAGATIEANSCFIDGVCYDSGETAELFGKVCFACNPIMSQTDWTVRDEIVGVTHCFVDDICVEDGGFKWSQRRTWAAKTYSTCQVCDTSDPYGWTILDGYSVPDAKILPPNDCVADDANVADETEDLAPIPYSPTSPFAAPTAGALDMSNPPETAATIKIASSGGVKIAWNVNAMGSIMIITLGVAVLVGFA